jgi:arabinogalactan endo-1,4-beta-galactosidase
MRRIKQKDEKSTDSAGGSKEEVQRLKGSTDTLERSEHVLPVAFVPTVSGDCNKTHCCILTGVLTLAGVLFLAAVVSNPTSSLSCTFRPSCQATAAVTSEDEKRDTSWNATTTADQLMVGTDASEAFAVEDGGGVFRRHEDDAVAPALSIVQEYGYEWIRLRIMVDPNGEYGLTQDLSYVLRMAREAKLQYGFRVLLDFHYSHWWTDGENQWSPPRWRFPENDTEVDVETLKQNLYTYTRHVLQVMYDEDCLPDAVQIGNEISSGMLWPQGQLPAHWNDRRPLPSEWHALKDLLQSGMEAVHSIAAENPDVERPLTVIHLDTGGSKDYTEQWLKTFFSLGGTCDVIGLSWYPMWHGTFEDLKDNIDNLSVQFPDQQVWVVETAYYYDGGCWDGDEECLRKIPYPPSEENQYKFLKALRETLLKTKCRAVFYWGSHWSQPSKWFRGTESWEDTERRALFDRTGRALKGFRGLVGL